MAELSLCGVRCIADPVEIPSSRGRDLLATVATETSAALAWSDFSVAVVQAASVKVFRCAELDRWVASLTRATADPTMRVSEVTSATVTSGGAAAFLCTSAAQRRFIIVVCPPRDDAPGGETSATFSAVTVSTDVDAVHLSRCGRFIAVCARTWIEVFPVLQPSCGFVYPFAHGLGNLGVDITRDYQGAVVSLRSEHLAIELLSVTATMAMAVRTDGTLMVASSAGSAPSKQPASLSGFEVFDFSTVTVSNRQNRFVAVALQRGQIWVVDTADEALHGDAAAHVAYVGITAVPGRVTSLVVGNAFDAVIVAFAQRSEGAEAHGLRRFPTPERQRVMWGVAHRDGTFRRLPLRNVVSDHTQHAPPRAITLANAGTHFIACATHDGRDGKPSVTVTQIAIAEARADHRGGRADIAAFAAVDREWAVATCSAVCSGGYVQHRRALGAEIGARLTDVTVVYGAERLLQLGACAAVDRASLQHGSRHAADLLVATTCVHGHVYAAHATDRCSDLMNAFLVDTQRIAQNSVHGGHQRLSALKHRAVHEASSMELVEVLELGHRALIAAGVDEARRLLRPFAVTPGCHPHVTSFYNSLSHP
jgi:hypothetical protein